MEIEYIEIYHYLADVAIIKNEYKNNMLIPEKGSYVRIDSGKYSGVYEVVNHVYYNSTKTLRINLLKK
jgi:hypothetical protein